MNSFQGGGELRPYATVGAGIGFPATKRGIREFQFPNERQSGKLVNGKDSQITGINSD